MLEAWQFGWVSSFDDALPYLPIALPFAIGTVVGGVDCTESAQRSDTYDTNHHRREALQPCWRDSPEVIQTTPYIGKSAHTMGGRVLIHRVRR